MSDQSTNEIEDRDRFRPPIFEITGQWKKICDEGVRCSFAFLRNELNEWIAEETERRIQEDSLARMPFASGLKFKQKRENDK